MVWFEGLLELWGWGDFFSRVELVLLIFILDDLFLLELFFLIFLLLGFVLGFNFDMEFDFRRVRDDLLCIRLVLRLVFIEILFFINDFLVINLILFVVVFFFFWSRENLSIVLVVVRFCLLFRREWRIAMDVEILFLFMFIRMIFFRWERWFLSLLWKMRILFRKYLMEIFSGDLNIFIKKYIYMIYYGKLI